MQSIQAVRSHSNVVSELEYNFQHTPSALSLPIQPRHIQAVPEYTPRTKNRRLPLIVRVNRLLRTSLVTLCGLALLGYGLDVAASNEVGKLQDQARRLNEQNTELSAQLLRAISFQGIQANVVGRVGLRVPEHVVIAKEIPVPTLDSFKPNKHYLPLQHGF